MPEGPEIRNAADRLESAIRPFEVDDIHFAFAHLQPHAARLCRRRITAVETRGKALLIRFDNDLSIYNHNQLYGRWMIRDRGDYPTTRRQLRLAIHNERYSALLYSASTIEVLTSRQVSEHPYLAKLGPDVLSGDDGRILAQLQSDRFRRRRLASLLLDQQFLAGIGNYLRSEILFVSGLHPLRRPADCSDQELQALAAAAVAVARQAYRHRGLTNDLRIARRLRAEGQTFRQYRHWVFARGGESCRSCRTQLITETAAGRRIYYCPRCQPA